MIISVGGYMGSGKSTLAKQLAEKLGWKYYYIGGLRRTKAKERGMTLAEYNKLGEIDPTTDSEVDSYQTELGQKEDNFVIEGRASWNFIPQSLKIYLEVDQRVAAERIFGDLQKSTTRNEDHELKTVEEVLESLKKREQSDRVRYQKYYGFDVYDPNHYDLVIDTSSLAPGQVFELIWSFVSEKLASIDKKTEIL